MKVRREIANAIINGHTFGTFEGEFEDNELMGELNPVFVHQLRELSETHKNAVEGRKQESAARYAAQQLEQEDLEEREENDEEVGGSEDSSSGCVPGL